MYTCQKIELTKGEMDDLLQKVTQEIIERKNEFLSEWVRVALKHEIEEGRASNPFGWRLVSGWKDHQCHFWWEPTSLLSHEE